MPKYTYFSNNNNASNKSFMLFSKQELFAILEQCKKNYLARYETRIYDRVVLRDVLEKTLHIEFPQGFFQKQNSEDRHKYKAHLGNYAGYIAETSQSFGTLVIRGTNVLTHDAKTIKLSEWYVEKFLSLHLYLLIIIYLEVKEGKLDKDLPAHKGVFIKALFDEIWAATNAYAIGNTYRKAFGKKTVDQDQLRSFAENFFTFLSEMLPSMQNGDEIRFPCGTDKHAIYLIFARHDDNMLMRVDNLGSGLEHDRFVTGESALALKFEANSSEKGVIPKVISEIKIRELANNKENICNFIFNVCNNLIQGEEALKYIYLAELLPKPSTIEFGYPPLDKQIISNCVTEGFMVGTRYRLWFLDTTKFHDAYNWLVTRLLSYVDLEPIQINQTQYEKLLMERKAHEISLKQLPYPTFFGNETTVSSNENNNNNQTSLAKNFKELHDELCDFYQANNSIMKRINSKKSISVLDSFINLAIIDKTKQISKITQEFSSKLDRNTLYRNYENIYNAEDYELMRIDDLLYRAITGSSHHLLIFGRPGVGKSSLCSYLTCSWSVRDRANINPHSWFARFELVIRVNLRNLTAERYGKEGNVTLGKIIHIEYLSQRKLRLDLSSEEIDRILHAYRDKILFIFDGLDEFNSKSPCANAIDQAIKDPNLYVVATSRPYIEIEKSNFSLQVELMGFSKDEMERYVTNVEGYTTKASQILRLLRNNTTISSLARTPIILDMLCSTWEEHDFTQISNITVTDFYFKLIENLWNNYRKYLEPLELPEKIIAIRKELIENFLEQLAFQGMLSSSVLLKKDWFIKCKKMACERYGLELDAKDILDAGFLEINHAYEALSYFFNHLSIQEVFAAIYVSKAMSTNRPLIYYDGAETKSYTVKQFVNKFKFHPRFELMWWFVSGALKNQPKIQAELFKQFEQGLDDAINIYPITLLIGCFNEAGTSNKALNIQVLINKILPYLKNLFTGDLDDSFMLDALMCYLSQGPAVFRQNKIIGLFHAILQNKIKLPSKNKSVPVPVSESSQYLRISTGYVSSEFFNSAIYGYFEQQHKYRYSVIKLYAIKLLGMLAQPDDETTFELLSKDLYFLSILDNISCHAIEALAKLGKVHRIGSLIEELLTIYENAQNKNPINENTTVIIYTGPQGACRTAIEHIARIADEKNIDLMFKYLTTTDNVHRQRLMLFGLANVSLDHVGYVVKKISPLINDPKFAEEILKFFRRLYDLTEHPIAKEQLDNISQYHPINKIRFDAASFLNSVTRNKEDKGKYFSIKMDLLIENKEEEIISVLKHILNFGSYGVNILSTLNKLLQYPNRVIKLLTYLNILKIQDRKSENVHKTVLTTTFGTSKAVYTDTPSMFNSNNKTSISSFSQSHLSTKRDPLHGVDKVSTWLKNYSHIPADFQLGSAIGQGDCFFDAVAQGLNQLTGTQACDVKSLRLFCDTYAKEPSHTWVKEAILKDEGNYEQYLTRIAFTIEEMASADWNTCQDPAIWGRPHIEGRMICEQYAIQLHVIEVWENEDQSTQVMEQLVTKQGSRSIEPMAEGAYTDAHTLHIVVYRNHFVPLLPKATHQVELKPPLTLFNEHSRKPELDISFLLTEIDLLEKPEKEQLEAWRYLKLPVEDEIVQNLLKFSSAANTKQQVIILYLLRDVTSEKYLEEISTMILALISDSENISEFLVDCICKVHFTCFPKLIHILLDLYLLNAGKKTWQLLISRDFKDIADAICDMKDNDAAIKFMKVLLDFYFSDAYKMVTEECMLKINHLTENNLLPIFMDKIESTKNYQYKGVTELVMERYLYANPSQSADFLSKVLFDNKATLVRKKMSISLMTKFKEPHIIAKCIPALLHTIAHIDENILLLAAVETLSLIGQKHFNQAEIVDVLLKLTVRTADLINIENHVFYLSPYVGVFDLSGHLPLVLNFWNTKLTLTNLLGSTPIKSLLQAYKINADERYARMIYIKCLTNRIPLWADVDHRTLYYNEYDSIDAKEEHFEHKSVLSKLLEKLKKYNKECLPEDSLTEQVSNKIHDTFHF